MIELLCAALVPLSVWLTARYVRRAASGSPCDSCGGREACGGRRGKGCERGRDGV